MGSLYPKIFKVIQDAGAIDMDDLIAL